MRRYNWLVIGAAAMVAGAGMAMAFDAARMTGGGSVIGIDAQGQSVRVTHGFELHCDPSQGPNRMTINWGGNRFQLTELTSISCFSDGLDAGPPPDKGDLGDLYNGCGVGTYNGTPGYTICFVFTDHGEPGKNDTAEYFISQQTIVLNVPQTTLSSGNHQVLPE